jgi:CheY-like chemotaxis protein
VESGAEALSLLSREWFDLVLMDVQMPRTDGIEATEIIRDSTSPVLDHRIPIIALTARVMRGDRERFLQAGMDDYVSKPFHAEQLLEVIERHVMLRREEEKLPADVLTEASTKDGAIDVEGVLFRLDGDEELLREIWGDFMGDVPHQLEKINAAITREDRASVELIAHSLKTACANVGACSMSESAFRLEQMAPNAKWNDVREGYETVQQKWALVREAIASELRERAG